MEHILSQPTGIRNWGKGHERFVTFTKMSVLVPLFLIGTLYFYNFEKMCILILKAQNYICITFFRLKYTFFKVVRLRCTT